MTTLNAPRSRFRRAWTTMAANPITIKELRGRMRGRRAFTVLTVYLVLLSSFVLLLYATFAAASRDPFGPDGDAAGQVVFATVLAAQGFLVVFIGPAFTAGAITGEKERQTFDLLRTTLLSPRAIVGGKLVSALSYVLLLVLTAIPLQSIAFLLGGIELAEIIVAQLLIFVTAVTLALVGLYASSRLPSTISATVTAYAVAFGLIIGVPVLFLLFGSLFDSRFFGSGATGEMIASVLLFALMTVNLPGTIIISKLFLIEDSSYFFGDWSLISYPGFTVPSPWLIYVGLYMVAALWLFRATTRRLRGAAHRS